MARVDTETSTMAKRTLKREKIFTLSRLVLLLGCSSRAAQNRLKLWDTYTSYNQNGKYYALPEVPSYDQNGLWRYRDVGFSKHGNLKKTVIHLVAISEAGLTGRQLGDILGLSPQSFLHHFRDCPGIRREKHEGVFVYFSDNQEVSQRQMQQRHSLISRPTLASITDSEAVLILVAMVRHHNISAEAILNLPEIKKSKMKLRNIQFFLEHHGLVKKTLVSKP